MTQILQKRAPALNLRAGTLARQLIEKEGLQASAVDIVPGAAGGPKGIGIQGLDQAIFGDFFAQAHSAERSLALPLAVGVLPAFWRGAPKKGPNACPICIPSYIFIKKCHANKSVIFVRIC